MNEELELPQVHKEARMDIIYWQIFQGKCTLPKMTYNELTGKLISVNKIRRKLLLPKRYDLRVEVENYMFFQLRHEIDNNLYPISITLTRQLIDK